MKDYLSREHNRNLTNRQALEKALTKVYGPDLVLIAHHLCYTKNGTNVEIPAVDTFLFDHNAAMKIYGKNYKANLAELAELHPAKRIQYMAKHLK